MSEQEQSSSISDPYRDGGRNKGSDILIGLIVDIGEGLVIFGLYRVIGSLLSMVIAVILFLLLINIFYYMNRKHIATGMFIGLPVGFVIIVPLIIIYQLTHLDPGFLLDL